MLNGKTWQRNQDFVAREIGDDMILVPIRAAVVDLQCLFTLNETGQFIWKQLAEPSSLEQISKQLHVEFEVSKAQAITDTEEFILEMVKEGCVIESDA